MKLSSRQYMILDFIKREVNAKGYPPSVREIGETVGLASSSTVHGHLHRMKLLGLLTWEPTCSRTLKVIDQDVI